MSKLATISLNFSDGDKIYIDATCNTPMIFGACVTAAVNGKAVYSIVSTCLGYEIKKERPGHFRPEYVSTFCKGEYKWCGDSLYAKHYSLDKALHHVLELYRRG